MILASRTMSLVAFLLDFVQRLDLCNCAVGSKCGGSSASPAGRRPGTCRTLDAYLLDPYSLEKFLFSELYSKATRW